MQYAKNLQDTYGDEVIVEADDEGYEGAVYLKVSDFCGAEDGVSTAELTPAAARSLAKALKQAANVAEGQPAKKSKPAEIVDGEGDRWVLNDGGTYNYEFADGNTYYMGRTRNDVRRQFGIDEETA